MQKMELLLSKCPQSVISNHVLPMVYRALESDAQQIQELCLSIIPKFASLIEYSAMKNALLPRIKKLCIGTSYLSVRVNCLVCLGKLLEHLDKWLVLDEILPFLPQIPSKEPAVLMGMLGILKLTMSHKKLGITKEIMATKIIPFLMPLSIENGLTLNQFTSIMSVVKEMVSFVEAEHKTKLEQLNSIRQEHSSTLEMTQLVSSGQTLVPSLPVNNNKQGVEDMFKNLGLSGGDSNDTKPINKQPNIFNQQPKIDNGFQKQSSMSFEEKKTLAWNQEQHTKWSSRGQTEPLKPSHNAATSLINSNLQGLVKSPKPMDPLSSLPPLSTGFVPNNWPPSFGMPQPATQPLSFVGNYSPMITSPTQNNRPCFQAPSGSPASMDLRSLDSLLPNMGGRSNLTLAQMSANTNMRTADLASSPVLTPAPQSFNTSSITNSAKSDLEDLLG